jgi:HEAT repeat protein
MKNALNLKPSAILSLDRKTSLRLTWFRLLIGLLLSLSVIGVNSGLVSEAQKPRQQNRVWNVSQQPAGSGTMVSIAADSALGRAQNWQDSEGYHLVIPNTVAADSLKSVRGVKVRRVGTSLEMLFRTKQGSHVDVQAEGNEITLVVDKDLEAQSPEREPSAEVKTAAATSQEQQPVADSTQVAQPTIQSTPLTSSSPAYALASNSPSASPEPGTAKNAAVTTGGPSIHPAHDTGIPPPGVPVSAPPQPVEQVSVAPGDEGAMASIFSATSVFVIIALGLFGWLVTRKLRSRQELAATSSTYSEDDDWVNQQTLEGKIQNQNEGTGTGTSLVPSNVAAPLAVPSRSSNTRMQVAGPTSLFGAYRIDQEVGKLVLGQPHRMDVLASRAIDDRRAIETSLVKVVNGADLDESARKKAREALEEYGFVARQCATLLLAPDAFERSSAARALGEIKSEAALPFLLESLYDSESIVRNQAVVSIGELKMPSAIGALLDIARTHPDVPSGLLSRTLSACSVEGLDFFDAVAPEPAQLGTGQETNVVKQITHLEHASFVEELPETSDDEQFGRALSQAGNVDVQERAEALKTLAQFRVKTAVDAITRLARHDEEANVRASAIFNLGSIDHESVFPAILVGMADESREVRAAAARALNRLSFDRADAYVRVIETSDEATIHEVAEACVQAGLVSQNVDRLASSDYRQAYETFSLICLLAKADLNEPILNTIANHSNMEVRLDVIHLLAATGQPGVFEHLRQLAVRDGIGEEVKTALLEAMYKLDQAKQAEVENVVVSDVVSEPQFAAFETAPLEADAHQEVNDVFELGYHSDEEVES